MDTSTVRQPPCRFPEKLCVIRCDVCDHQRPAPEQLWFEWAGDIRGERLAGRAAAIKFIQERLAHAPREYLFALYLDDHLRLRDVSSLGRGSVDGVQFSIAELVRQGFAVEAACFLLIHNHPSGDPAPSPQDVRITSRIRHVTEELDMPLVDHLIVAAKGISSVGQW